MKIRNLYLAIVSQLPLKRLFKNFFITKNAWFLFSINSHINQKTKEPKVMYSSIEKANKSAQKMQEKFCNGYHIGKNKV